MICYRDMTFCSYWKECKDGINCFRALTSQVIYNAGKWWGKENPPISLFAEKPDCFKSIK